MESYVNFAVQKTLELLAIDSPTGYTADAESYVVGEFSALGFEAKRTVKGGILIDLGGKDEKDALLLEAHADT
jgi:putative aminopeptidase FrvX